MKKKFWMGSLLTMLLIGCIMICISLLAFFMRQDLAAAVFFGILTLLVMIACINFAAANDKQITFYSYLFLPHNFRYDQIFAMYHLTHPQKKQFTALYFHLTNGERKRISLGLYSQKKQEEIIDFITEKLTLNEEFYRDRNRLDLWLKRSRIRNIGSNCLLGSIMILAGVIFQIHTLSWDWKINHWTRTEAIIELNQEEVIQISEKEKIREYHLRYRYEFNGKRYTGNKIAGGAEKLPSGITPGSKIPCIVNPEDPEESALLTRYRADWISNFIGFVLLFFGIAGIIFTVIPLLRNVNVPEPLKDYIVQSEPEKVMELTKSLCGECRISVGKITGGYRELQDRYGCFPLSHNLCVIFILLILLVLSILGGRFVMPHFFLLSAGVLLLIYQNLFPRGIMFDLTEKKIFWSRYFSLKWIPEKIKRNHVLSTSDLTAIGLTLLKDNHLLLSVIRKDGVYVPVVKADLKHMEQLMSDSVILAEKMEKLPIIII